MKSPMVVSRSITFNGHDKVELRFTWDKLRKRYLVEVKGAIVPLPGFVIKQVDQSARIMFNDGQRRSVERGQWVVYEHDFRDGLPKTNLGAVVEESSPLAAYRAAVGIVW